MGCSSSLGCGGSSQRVVDHDYQDRMNQLLDKWRPGDVELMRRRFRSGAGTSSKHLDKAAFSSVFQLDDMPQSGIDAAFRMFDTDRSGRIDFREFCYALSVCFLSGAEEKIRFVFDMFDNNNDSVLSRKEVLALLETARKSVLQFQPGDAKPDGDADKIWIRNQLETLGDGNVSFDKFLSWAQANMDVSHILSAFEVVPPPNRERKVVERLLREATFNEGDTWYIVSYKWWELWQRYTGFDLDMRELAPLASRTAASGSPLRPARSVVVDDDHAAAGAGGQPGSSDTGDAPPPTPTKAPIVRQLSAMYGQRPGEIDNRDIQGNTSSELRVNLVPNFDFVLFPEPLWRQMVTWYGASLAFPRKVVGRAPPKRPPSAGGTPTDTTVKQLSLELYPPVLDVVLAGDDGRACAPSTRQLHVSRFTTLRELHSQMLEEYGYDGSYLPTACSAEVLGARLAPQPSSPRASPTQPTPPTTPPSTSPVAGVEEEEGGAGSGERGSPAPDGGEEPPANLVTAANVLDVIEQAYPAGPGPSDAPGKVRSRLWARLRGGGPGWQLVSPQPPAPYTVWEGEDVPTLDSRLEDLGVDSGDGWMLEVSYDSTPTTDSYGMPRQSSGRGWGRPKKASPAAGSVSAEDGWVWPRTAVKPPQFFHEFAVGDRLDARDRERKWYPARLVALQHVRVRGNGRVEVLSSEPPLPPPPPGTAPVAVEQVAPDEEVELRHQVVVRFDGFAPRWNEAKFVEDPALAHAGTQASSRQMPRMGPLLVAPTGAKKRKPATASYSVAGWSSRVSAPGRPAAPGATGLLNLGNTCFMNSVLQCLSNTPLLKDYMLGDLWKAELNRGNKAGSGGKMVHEFAGLLKQLWSNEYLYVAPTSFKQVLGRFHPDFAGNEQHDAQELMAALLDSIHEDLNRVTPASRAAATAAVIEEDDDTDAATESTAGGSRPVTATAAQVVPSAPFADDKAAAACREAGDGPAAAWASAEGDGDPAEEGGDAEDRGDAESRSRVSTSSRVEPIASTPATLSAIDVLEAASLSQHSNGITPQALPPSLGTRVGRAESFASYDTATMRLLAEVAAADGMPQTKAKRVLQAATRMWAQHVARHRSAIVDLFHGQLMSKILCLFCHSESLKFDPFMYLTLPIPIQMERPIYVTVVPLSVSWRGRRNMPPPPPPTPPVSAVAPVSASAPAADDTEPAAVDDTSTLDGTASVAATSTTVPPAGSSHTHTQSFDSVHSGSAPVPSGFDDADGATPVTYGILVPNTATVAQLKAKVEKATGGRVAAAHMVIAEVYLSRFHRVFNDTERLWNHVRSTDTLLALETASRWQDVYAHPQPALTRHRTATVTDTFRDFQPGDQVDCRDRDGKWFPGEVVDMDHAGGNVKIHFHNFDPKWDEWHHHTSNTLAPQFTYSPPPKEEILDIPVMHRRPARPKTGASDTGAGTDAAVTADTGPALELFGHPFFLQVSSFLTSSQLLSVVRAHGARYLRDPTATPQPFEVKLVDWRGLQCFRHRSNCTGCALAGDETDPRLAQRMGLVLDWASDSAYTPFPAVGGEEEEAVVTVQGVGEPSTESPPKDRLPSVLHRSYFKARAVEERRRAQDGGLPLSQCLDAFARAEALGKDNTWTCDKCKHACVAQKTSSVWAAPDILVVHLSRFYYTTHSKEKVTAMVDFPLEGFDLAPWCAKRPGVADGAVPLDKHMYDLFAVVDHMGGMGGGHYTASVLNTGGAAPKWFRYNDSSVSALDPNHVVSKQAYILFYRRRHLSPHNVINLTTPQ